MGEKHDNGIKTDRLSDRLFRLLLILLSLVLVVMVIAAAAMTRERSSRYYSKPNELLWMIRSGSYPDALTSMYDNIAMGETPEKDADYAVPYAILEYYEAASLYWAYTHADSASDPAYKAELTASAERFKAEMTDARSRMGDLEFFSEEIDEIFEK